MCVLLEQDYKGLGLGRTQGLGGCGCRGLEGSQESKGRGSRKLSRVKGFEEAKAPESRTLVGVINIFQPPSSIQSTKRCGYEL